MDFLNNPETDRIIQAAFVEDVGDGDHTTLSILAPQDRRRARCLIKEAGILAGVALAERIFETVGQGVRFEKVLEDGVAVQPGDVAFFVEGPARAILTAERIVLNFMQRMSGIATKTRHMVDLLDGVDCRLLDTRKTTPTVRHFEKWAGVIGGGTNHRFGLYDMVMIKDNHHDYAGGIRPAIERVQDYLQRKGLDLRIEVETRNLAEVQEVLDVGGIHRIMLDNMSVEDMKAAVELIGGRYEVEASGNIDAHNVREKALTGVDFLSMGALTHSVNSLDISLKAY